MRFPKIVLLIVCSVILMSCGGSNDSGSVNFDYVVDVLTGDDSNAGTTANPFKTISKALSVAASGERIKVRPGVYTAGAGETFPLWVPEGVELIGNEATIGLDTIIDGTATWPSERYEDPNLSVLLASDSVFAGFSMNSESDYQRIGVLLDGDRIQVRNNTITGISTGTEPGYGVAVISGSNQRIIGNTLNSNYTAGLNFILDAGNDAVVQDNLINNNYNFGVLITGSGPVYIDLGGGTQGSAGNNVLSCNPIGDLAAGAGRVVDARNNFWDHVPPTRFPPDDFPADIRLSNGVFPEPIVNTGADELAAAPCT